MKDTSLAFTLSVMEMFTVEMCIRDRENTEEDTMAAGRKKAVIFDMDGVLIDSEMVYLRSMLAFARKRRPEITESDLLGVVGRSAKDSWEIVEKAVSNGQTWEELREAYRNSTDVYETTDYRKIFRQEVRPVLKILQENGYLMAVSYTHLVIL